MRPGLLLICYVVLAVCAEAQTPATVAAPEIESAKFLKQVKGSLQGWKDRQAWAFETGETPKEFKYSINGKRHSKERNRESLINSILQDFVIDDFEATFAAPYPSVVVLTYRDYRHLLLQGKMKTFNCYVKETYEYVDQKWLRTKWDAMPAK